MFKCNDLAKLSFIIQKLLMDTRVRDKFCSKERELV